MAKSSKQLNIFRKNRNSNLSKANAMRSKKADDRAIRLVPVLKEIFCEGAQTCRDVAKGLMYRDIIKPRGSHIWHDKDIALLLERIAGLHSDTFSDAEKNALFSCIENQDED